MTFFRPPGCEQVTHTALHHQQYAQDYQASDCVLYVHNVHNVHAWRVVEGFSDYR